MISLKAPHNNLMPYTQQSILNTVKNNQLPEDIKSSLVSCVDIFKVLIKQYYDYPYDCRDDLVDDDKLIGFAPIFPDICYHLTHYKPAAADIPVASDNPAHYADAIRYNARTPLQGSLLPLTRLVWA